MRSSRDSGPDGEYGAPLAAAALAVLRDHDFRAGRFSIGFRSCDYGTVNGGVSDPVCTAHARAFAADARVLGVVGTWHSQCAMDELPILAAPRAGPSRWSAPRTPAGLTMTGRRTTPG